MYVFCYNEFGEIMNYIKATDARKNWSETIDAAVRQKPQLIKRNRDVLTLISVEQIDGMLQQYSLTLEIIKEKDGSYSGSFDELDIVSNAPSKETLMEQVLIDLIEYSQEYMENFSEYFASSNRKAHFPYIYKIILFQDNPNKIRDFIERVG